MNFSEPPPGRLAIVFGDLLFNLRPALDHIAVAIAPPVQKRSAGFPLCDRDNGEDRKQFLRTTVGMPPSAVERIASLQPYAVQQRATRQGQIYNLSTLSALHNADKHRALSILAPGLLDPTVTWSWANEQVGRFQPDLAGQDAEILTSAEIGNVIRFRDLRVHVSGSVLVSAFDPSSDDYYSLLEVASMMIRFVRERVLPDLAPYAR
jgi:hypothetical protein